ncbi:MAG: NAD(P)-binding protein [Acidimicrobiales bacterium]
MRDHRYDILFEPIRIGPKVLRNRFVQVPHCSHFGVDLPGSQAGLRAMKAEGGWAMVNTEYCSIHPESDDYPRNFARLWDDDDVANLSVMTAEVHRHGALAGVELWFGAAHAGNYETRVPPRGVSQLNSDDFHNQSCYAMSVSEIHELQDFYVSAARRAVSAGFDVINVYAGHFHTITLQFLAQFYNKRTDDYGGSFENRVRFLEETLQKIRAEVGDACAVGSRFNIDSLRGDDGIEVHGDGLRVVEYLDDHVDFWDLHVGSITNWEDDSGPSRIHQENWTAPWVGHARSVSKKPIIAVGRFVSPDVMVDVITSGVADVIGCARPSIADPFLPLKIEEGRFDDICECIGCNICIATVWGVGSRLKCTQNATVGEEFRRGWHPERFTMASNAHRRVLVVGAGPAGLECARVLGERDMAGVHLVEAGPDVGGAMGWIPNLPGLGEWRRFVGWRESQITKLANVEIVTGCRLDVSGVLDYGAEIVVVATGSTWSRDGLNPVTHDPIPGVDASAPHVLTPEQVMVDDKPIPGEAVVVYDTDGYFIGPSLAERLAIAGHRVRLVSPHAEPGGFLHFTGEFGHVHRRLYELGAEIVGNHTLSAVHPGGVVASHHYRDERVEWAADAVVLVTQRVSRDALYHSLVANATGLADAGIVAVHRIGDCVVPGLVADATFAGHRLAREIDGEDPTKHQPFIRERVVMSPSTYAQASRSR